MRVIEVGRIPEKKHRGHKHNLYGVLDKFVELNVKCGKIEFEDADYSNINSAYTNLSQSARYGGFKVDVIRRCDEIYLMRTDME